jgi:citrate synthase
LTDSTEKFLTGTQAAEFLGVKSATLYAYASRGLIESLPAESGRERAYRLSDLIKLRQSARGFKSAKDTEAATWTGPAIKSSITEISDDGHCYRGQSAIALALAGQPFESVAELLWDTPSSYKAWKKVKPFAISKQLKTAASTEVDYLDLLKLLLVSEEMADPIARKLMAEDVFDTARRLIVTMALTPGLAENRHQYVSDSDFPIAQTILAALSGNKSRERARLINCALVVCADHELNASALAARIAASCDASLYSCLLSALAAFSGSLHGSASRRAEDIVASSLKFKSAKAWLKNYLRQFERIPGFGTDLYTKGDPRARILIDAAQSVSSKDRNLRRLFEIVECVREQLGTEPNLDVGLAAISYALSLPPGSGSTIFAISRTAGWIAHSIEQRLYGGLIRPRARYIGKTPALSG